MLGIAISSGLLGTLTWSLLEYVIHRWVAHGRGVWRSTPFGDEHTRHHAEGNYFAPALKKVPLAVIILAIVTPLAIAVTHPLAGGSFAASFVLTYVAYEVFHRRLHTHAGTTAYGRWAREHHFHHHFADPKTNHGVTSPLWDLVFGTYRRPARIHVPQRLCMSWLVDPRTGGVIDGYADRFVITKKHAMP